jgi:succinate dehydrogenase / fumarate reductase cytochrome b subunit
MEEIMRWLMQTLGSSIGKKLMMALTGLAFIGFLAVHLIGNLSIYGGRAAFNAYAEKLHSLGPILTVFELGLLGLALLHIATGLLLFVQNLRARPQRYSMDKRAGGRTYSSITMPYTGLLILAFVVFHLINFSFVDKTDTTIFDIVSQAFAQPFYVVTYIFAMIVVAFHVRHGLWSAFQSIGVNHPKYMPAVMILSLVFSLFVGFGFGLLPIYISSAV